MHTAAHVGVLPYACSWLCCAWNEHHHPYYACWHTSLAGVSSAGDQSGNLLWRLRRGERQQRHTPLVTLVHIGAADLEAAFRSGGSAAAHSAVPGIVSRWALLTSTMVLCCLDHIGAPSLLPRERLLVRSISPMVDV